MGDTGDRGDTEGAADALRVLLDEAEQWARATYRDEARAEITPKLLLSRRNGDVSERVICQLPAPADDEGMRRMLFAMRVLAAEQRAECGVLVNEGWMSEVPNDQLGTAPRPSKDPNRVEVLMLTGDSEGGAQEVRAYTLHRKASGTEMERRLTEGDGEWRGQATRIFVPLPTYLEELMDMAGLDRGQMLRDLLKGAGLTTIRFDPSDVPDMMRRARRAAERRT